MPNSVRNLVFPSFLADFLGMLLLEKEYWNFGQPLRFKMSDFLIRMWSNFPKPFRLVRKTLLISFLSIWHDLVRRESSYEPGCSENQSFCPKTKFSGGLLDFGILDFPAWSPTPPKEAWQRRRWWRRVTKFPRGSRPYPPLASRIKISHMEVPI